jgi:predicted transcriptional regulator
VRKRRVILMPRPLVGRAFLTEFVAKTLRAMRERAGVSQEMLAWTAEVDRTYIGKLERNRFNPTLVRLDHLLTTLDVSWAEFGAKLDAAKAMQGQQ